MISIEQALISLPPGERIVHSPGFLPNWQNEAVALCMSFAPREEALDGAGLEQAEATFACPFVRDHVAIVRVRGMAQSVLRFRMLILKADDYALLDGDPFWIDEHCTPVWEDPQPATLTLPGEALPPRTVAEVQRVLKRPESAWFFGGVQALLDGSKLVLGGNTPDPSRIRDLWALVPYSSRLEIWPATFAFSNRLGFDVLVTPAQDLPQEYLREEQAENYPEGRYELNLRIAADTNDQHEVDRLFRRRSRAQAWRLGLWLLAGSLLLMLVSNLVLKSWR